jgi:hypothetical protein
MRINSAELPDFRRTKVRSIFDGLLNFRPARTILSDPASHQKDTISAGATGASLAVMQQVRLRFPNATGSPEYFPLELTLTVGKYSSDQ